MTSQKSTKVKNKKTTRSSTAPTAGNFKKPRRQVLSVSQILARVRKQRQRKLDQKKRKKTN